MNRPHIVIIGLMGAGKTTTADLLAARLGLTHRDSDRDIETLTGQSGREHAETCGVDHLHQLEQAVLLGALAATDPLVITAAGWTVESDICRDALRRRATVVWLDLPVDTLQRRMADGTHRRTMTDAELETLIHRRIPLLEASADITIDATSPPQDIVQKILRQLPPEIR